MKSNLYIKFCPYCGYELVRKMLEGRKRLYCSSCGKIYYENPTPVVAMIARDEEGNILLIKRKEEPCKGKWALPSGFMELEESPIEAALRELAEETGIKGKPKKLIGVYPNNSTIHGHLITIIYEVEILGGKLCAGDDAEKAEFFPINQIPPLAFQSHWEALNAVLK
ncbi:MAG TPA: NUDIX domain-containing protein [Candidatus Atribacteria bacterium]|nr:NUDIX domain-containing protein [Candidatus Atribacteria bacterium]